MPIVESPHVETLILSQCSMHRVRDRALKMSFKDVKEPVEVYRSFVSAARTNICRCSAGICVALATTTTTTPLKQAGHETVVRCLLQRAVDLNLEGQQVLFVL